MAKSKKHREQGAATTDSGLSPAVRFILTFVVLLVVIGGAYAYLSARFHDNMLWVMDATAAVSGGIASVFSSDVTWSGQYITYRGFAVQIIDECTGLLEMVIYLAAMLAFSTSLKNKALGLAFGVPAIYLFNIIRIWVLLISGAYSKALFDFMHLYFWQATLIIMIATVWVGWLYLVVFREEKRTLAVSR